MLIHATEEPEAAPPERLHRIRRSAPQAKLTHPFWRISWRQTNEGGYLKQQGLQFRLNLHDDRRWTFA
jgi:hypothetical protein